MAYAVFSVTFGEQPSASKWNILGTNDASFRDGTGFAWGASAVVTGGAISTTTPTWTGSVSNPAIGNGTLSTRYQQIGKWVYFTTYLLCGSTTTYGSGNFRFSYPVTPRTWTSAEDLMPIGQLTYSDSGSYNGVGVAVARSALGTASYEMFFTRDGTGVPTAASAISNITNVAAQTWANGDGLRIMGQYEAA